MFVLLVVTLIVIAGIYVWIRCKRPDNYPPGPPCLPIIGCVPFMPRGLLHLEFMKWKKIYGPVVGMVNFGRRIVAVTGPQAVMEVLKRDEFQARPDNFVFRDRSFNKRLGILFSDGDYWSEQRRFSLRHLRDLGFGKTSTEGIIHEEIDDLLKIIGDKKTHQAANLFTVSVVNVLLAIVAGTRYSHDDKDFEQILAKLNASFRSQSQAGNLIGTFPFLRFIVPGWMGYTTLHTANEMTQELFRGLIREHEKTYDEHMMRDFIDIYLREMKLNQSAYFTEESLIIICMDLFSAGAESVSNTLSFSLLYMVLHPDIQRKVQEELDTVIGRNRKASLDDRKSLPYVEAVLAEVSRINSIAPLTVPHASARDTHLQGYVIPKNTGLLVSMWSILHDKEHWGDPEVFRPARFLDSKDGKFVRDEWLCQFGIGKRICPGESLARNNLYLFFTCFLQEFTVSVPEGEPQPSTVSLKGITTAPQPFRISVVRRV